MANERQRSLRAAGSHRQRSRVVSPIAREHSRVPVATRVVRAYTGQQALERARTAQPDMIILDAQMPDIHGFEVCRMLRSDPRFSATTPIVITTSGPSGRTQRLEAYRAGAWEFLGQPLDGESLLLKLGTFLQCKLEVDALREESLLDAGTGLYNMRGLSHRAHEIGADAFRRRDPLACVVISPEAEESGPGESSDEEIQRIAEQVGQLLKRDRTRIGCDRPFGSCRVRVIAPATSSEGALRLIQRLGASIEGSPIPVRGGERSLRSGRGTAPSPTLPSLRSTPWSSCSAPQLRFASSSGTETRSR